MSNIGKYIERVQLKPPPKNFKQNYVFTKDLPLEHLTKIGSEKFIPMLLHYFKTFSSKH